MPLPKQATRTLHSDLYRTFHHEVPQVGSSAPLAVRILPHWLVAHLFPYNFPEPVGSFSPALSLPLLVTSSLPLLHSLTFIQSPPIRRNGRSPTRQNTRPSFSLPVSSIPSPWVLPTHSDAPIIAGAAVLLLLRNPTRRGKHLSL